jgi:LL-diaminopimelate aminotransferase
LRKRVIIDRADRLYQLAPPLEDFYPHTLAVASKKLPQLDLARPFWGAPGVEPTEETSGARVCAKTLLSLKESIADWALSEMSVKLNPEKEIFVSSSVRRLLSLVALGYLDPGDLALTPNPGYPAYRQMIITYGAEPIDYRLTEKRGFKPRFKQFSDRVGKAARLMFLNNPHNPTASELDIEELDELLWLAARDNILIVNDAAYYSFAAHDGASVLGSPSGKRIGLELYDIPFLFGSTGARLAFAIGSRDLIAGLSSAEVISPDTLYETHARQAVEELAKYPSQRLHSLRSRIRDAFPAACLFCEALGLEPVGRQGFPYLLARVPRRNSSRAFSSSLLRRQGIVTLPAIAFGDLGEGYVRLALTSGPLPFQEAVERLSARKLRTG